MSIRLLGYQYEKNITLPLAVSYSIFIYIPTGATRLRSERIYMGHMPGTLVVLAPLIHQQ